jgi:hypothetical protein
MQRGDQFRQPLALYQAGILALALMLVGQLRLSSAAQIGMAVGAAMLSTAIGLVVGGGSSGFENLVALGLAGLLLARVLHRFRGAYESEPTIG